MKKTLYDFCLETGKAHLLVQWDDAGNLPDTPKTISHGSRKQAWWACDQGHRWQAAVKSRVAGCGCPVYAGRTSVRTRNIWTEGRGRSEPK